jgi:hypothetical protein
MSSAPPLDYHDEFIGKDDFPVVVWLAVKSLV